MMTGKVLFLGKDHIHQFLTITELLGTPSEELVNSICSEPTLKFVKGLPQREPTPLSTRFPDCNPDAIDLLGKLLVFDPKERITAEEALRHPFLKEYSEELKEFDLIPPGVFDWSFTEMNYNTTEWKDRVIDCIEKWKSTRSAAETEVEKK